MRVHELAKQLGRESKELIAILQEKGYEGKTASSSVDESAVSIIMESYGGSKKAAGDDDKKGEPDKKAISPVCSCKYLSL